MSNYYGVSSKYEFRRWDHNVLVFSNYKASQDWLNCQENDFRERELMSRTDCIKLVGRYAVESAEKRVFDEW